MALSEPVVGLTQLSESPLSRVMAMRPLRRTFSNSLIWVFLMVPLVVVM